MMTSKQEYPDVASTEVSEKQSQNGDSPIPVQYRGTAADREDMDMLGRRQILRRNFKFISMLGLASTVMASWEITLPLFTFVLIDGGTALLFWGFIAVGLGLLLVYASIAEMASMSPTAGGQYHWVSEFAPPSVQKLLSYTVGWLTAIGWQVYLAGVSFMAGTVIQGLIVLDDDQYVWQNWHGTMLTIAVILFCVIFNTILAKHLPTIAGVILFLHLAGIFAIIGPLWAMGPRADAHTVIFEFSNNGGWSSTGLSSMIGLVTPLSVMVGYDCSVHMSEEIRDASITLPRAIMSSVGINASLSFLMGVTLIFNLGDITSILASPTRQPFIQIFYDATQSHAATTVMVVIVVILLISSAISEVATTSRQIWSFARDGGLPASSWLSQVSTRWNAPLNAVCVSVVITALLACINIGSSTALNAINSLGCVSILTSYFICISCLIWRRMRGPPLPPRRWSLGRFGLAINVASLLFIAPLWLFAFWPLGVPVTPANMNWASLMFGGTITFALLYYLVWARHTYTGPVVHMKRI